MNLLSMDSSMLPILLRKRDGEVSHPILRIKWDAKSYVHQEISHTHNQQIINSIITSVYYIMNKTESSHKCSESIKKRSLAEAPYHRDVNWLTTSLVIFRKIIITTAICYPFEIFIQILKINKHKYMSYLTSVTRGS